MKRLNPILIFVSVLILLLFVSTITILSTYENSPKPATCKIEPAKTNELHAYAMADPGEGNE